MTFHRLCNHHCLVTGLRVRQSRSTGRDSRYQSGDTHHQSTAGLDNSTLEKVEVFIFGIAIGQVESKKQLESWSLFWQINPCEI